MAEVQPFPEQNKRKVIFAVSVVAIVLVIFILFLAITGM